MINLRYHIVSLTAVFLAIGIGLTLGSTFLDRATVDNLNGQLENLDSRLSDREARINDLEQSIKEDDSLQTALDEQATGLLAGHLDNVPVVVIASRGVKEADVNASVQAMVVAGGDVQGVWWFTDRWLLDDDAEVADLATLLGQDSTDPSRLRRAAIDRLGGELRGRQFVAPPETSTTTVPDGSDTTVPDGETTVTTATTTVVPDADPAATTTTTINDPGSVDGEPLATNELAVLTALVDHGFIEFETVPGGPDVAQFPAQTHLLLVGGSNDVPDDLVVEPLVVRLSRNAATPVLGVAGSALPDDGGVSDLVTMIRQDDRLRELVPTVDELDHFEGWAAMVLALADVGDGVVGHYGLGEDASRLLPALRTP